MRQDEESGPSLAKEENSTNIAFIQATPVPWGKLIPVLIFNACDGFNGSQIFAYLGKPLYF